MLRELTDIKTDILVLCPDVVTNCALHDLVDLHRLRGASATCLVTAKMEAEEGTKKPKGEDTEKDIMGLDSSTRWGTVFDPDEAQQSFGSHGQPGKGGDAFGLSDRRQRGDTLGVQLRGESEAQDQEWRP